MSKPGLVDPQWVVWGAEMVTDTEGGPVTGPW
jgi:hypothetical protein